MSEDAVKVIAFYLPQFHPIKENDEWWGKGFTEWTNVAKARPMFLGHEQPHIPADLGFYDLRLSETREDQAKMAMDAGVTGFAYWHYWFAGRRILERPFNEVLASGKPDYPFCLAWANETWSGIWHGNPKKILIEQTYPGADDFRAHYEAVRPAFMDKRYIKVDGKPMFLVYRPQNIPDTDIFFQLWNDCAQKDGFNGIHFVAVSANVEKEYDGLMAAGYGGVTPNRLAQLSHFTDNLASKMIRRIIKRPFTPDYRKAKAYLVRDHEKLARCYPAAIPAWDNTPRSGLRGFVLTHTTPEQFEQHFKEVVDVTRAKERPEDRILFLKSWNEWAEGNYVEPDRKWGSAYLDVIRKVLKAL